MIKKYSDNKLIALNMIWSMVAVAVNYAITFFMTSYVTNTAGAEAFGFVTLSNTLTSYIDVISIALNAFACRYISIAFHKGNIEEANKYFNSVIIADTVLSIFIIAIGTPTILNLEHILNISRELVVDVKILFVLYIFVNRKYLDKKRFNLFPYKFSVSQTIRQNTVLHSSSAVFFLFRQE